MAQPHAAYGAENIDIIWYAVSDGIKTLLGKQLVDLRAGSGFANPGDGRFYHANVNTSETDPIHLIWLRASAPGASTAGGITEEPKYYRLDPQPYDPKVDLDPHLFMGHWKESMPRHEHGSLIVRDIFTPNTTGDPFKPERRGAVLKRLNYVGVGTLDAGMKTTPSTLSGEQKVFYVLDGAGSISGGGKALALQTGSGGLIPEGVEFVLENTGGCALKLYLASEPTYDGFIPRKDILVRDESTTPYRGNLGHWSNMDTPLFRAEDGLAYLVGGYTVSLAPMMIPEMHPTKAPEDDVVWYAIDGDIYTLLGKQLFHLEPGSGFVNPGDNRFNHGNINISKDRFIKMFWLRTRTP